MGTAFLEVQSRGGGMLGSELPSSRKLEGSRWEPCTLREHLSETQVESWKWDFIGPVQFQVKSDLGEKSRSAGSGGVRASAVQGGFLVRQLWGSLLLGSYLHFILAAQDLLGAGGLDYKSLLIQSGPHRWVGDQQNRHRKEKTGEKGELPGRGSSL